MYAKTICLVASLFVCALMPVGCIGGSTLPGDELIPPPPSPPVPPLPVNEPEEPALIQYDCGDFPTLPTSASQAETIYYLTSDSSCYVWNYDCRPPAPSEDPNGPPDPNLLVITQDWGNCNSHLVLIKLDNLQELPKQAKKVSLELFCVNADSALLSDPWGPTMEFLEEEWLCPERNPQTWYAYSDDELPETSLWQEYIGLDVKADEWLSLEITRLFNQWQTEEKANYGLILKSSWFVDDKQVYYSTRYSEDLALRPRLVITANAELTLKFPLEGKYSVERINLRGQGGNFGDWWEGERCDNNDPQSPRLRHTGVDLHAAVGDPVYAVADGVVKYAQLSPEQGGYVVLEHDKTWTSTYTHVIPLTSGGETALRGEKIGSVAPISGAHLHFQVRLARYEEPWSRRGRLPDEQCFIFETGRDEPQFPEYFLDPKCLSWE